MNFRAPSTSASSTISATSVTPQHTHVKAITMPKKTRATSRRTRVHKLDKAKSTAKVVTKRDYKTKQLVEPSVAYVGNIGPDVDENALKAHFGRYGKILYHENMRVRQYAIVVFESKPVRYRACKQENVLGGRKLVVSVVVSDLPEVQEKVIKRLEDYRTRLEPPDVHRARKSALKSLKLEGTELLDARYQKERRKRRRFQLFGHSLAEGIM